nr:heparan-alpha-glucosaminide N-acetyltransferase domain-containing protein [uncultured Holophaga sp.]
MSLSDLSPSRRCEWIDLLRGWAVIVMIEVHVVNLYVHPGWVPTWLNFLNGLVAPSFILCAGFSLVLSTFRPDGTLRPFGPTARRLGFILICAYALHAPGLTLAEWTVLLYPARARELFKVDVLQCIVFSLLFLQGVARLCRRPGRFGWAALMLALACALVAPHLWARGVGDGLWLPVRGLLNGNPDRGVTALFPLFPWLAFAAFGSVLGVLYRHFRVMPAGEGRARWSEGRWLLILGLGGLLLAVWGTRYAPTWLWSGSWPREEAWRLHNTTLPSVLQRFGIVCMAGALLGWIERVRPRLPGRNPVLAAGAESLLLYMFHLFLLFGLLIAKPVVRLTGWEPHGHGWAATLGITALVILLSLGLGLGWQAVRRRGLTWRVQRVCLCLLGCYFLGGGWMTFRHFWRSPELAEYPYPFLNRARARKGLPPTPDGLSRDPREVAREKQRRRIALSAEEREMVGLHP